MELSTALHIILHPNPMLTLLVRIIFYHVSISQWLRGFFAYKQPVWLNPSLVGQFLQWLPSLMSEDFSLGNRHRWGPSDSATRIWQNQRPTHRDLPQFSPCSWFYQTTSSVSSWKSNQYIQTKNEILVTLTAQGRTLQPLQLYRNIASYSDKQLIKLVWPWLLETPLTLMCRYRLIEE